MEVGAPYGTQNNVRSFSGCWTCRLRRKKCDEKHPACTICTTLDITCHYSYDKPDWMDGGKRQEQMAERLKREVKEKARWRRGDRPVQPPEKPTSLDVLKALPERRRIDATASGRSAQGNGALESETCGSGCKSTKEKIYKAADVGPFDTLLLTFYIEQVLPFLFPFYRPSLLQGGKSWILEMVLTSPVVRQATLCQSSYFFALAQTTGRYVPCNKVLGQTQEAFEVLRRALEVMRGPGDVSDHIFGSVRVLASIMQVQRFELAVLSFENCQTHLNAALALFKQLLGTTEPSRSGADFNALLARLGPSAWIANSLNINVPSAEQSALRFSAALLIFDDIIASTARQEPPKIHDMLDGLLGEENGLEPPIDLEAVVGCQNLVLLQIGKIASLDSWKQECKRAGTLDHVELERNADLIENTLRTRLMYMNEHSATPQEKEENLLDIFAESYCVKAHAHARQNSLVPRVWAHAALIYLFVVRHGWQPSMPVIRTSVDDIIEALAAHITSPALLRSMVWPFCVAGCMATNAQEEQLRRLVNTLQPPSVFGTVYKARDIMESVWKKRNTPNIENLDFATCFRSQGDLVLLI